MSKIAMMQLWKNSILALVACVLLASCGSSSNKNGPTNTLTSGELTISVDETYKPVMEELIKVFMSNYPNTKIIADYKPESIAIRDFLEGKTRLIFVSRPLTKEESDFCLTAQIVPESLAVAKDAVAIVVNQASKDTSFSIPQLKGILSKGNNSEHTLVFDNEGSSTLHFIADTLMKGAPLNEKLYAAKSNEATIDYVKQNKSAVGFVGLSYIIDTMDSTAEKFSSQVRVASVQNDSSGNYYLPYQAAVALKHYPLVRKLYFIKGETYAGLASGFSNFVKGSEGQLVIGHARLMPLNMTIVIREAAINQ
jgi:phosphate transport system substrate-binding protein